MEEVWLINSRQDQTRDWITRQVEATTPKCPDLVKKLEENQSYNCGMREPILVFRAHIKEHGCKG